MNEPGLRQTIDTKERILDAAERLFDGRGVAATSLRRVIAEAGVNLAAIHYHFGSKDQLLKAVVDRRVGPVNRHRLALLEEYERAADGPVPAGQIVDAFVRPLFEAWFRPGREPVVTRLIGRLLGEPDFFQKVAPEQFRQVRDRFVPALGRALPALEAEELFWKLMMMVGSVTYVLRAGDFLARGSRAAPGSQTRRWPAPARRWQKTARVDRALPGTHPAPGQE